MAALNAGLALAALAMGAASTPHCALMCGSPCAALTGGHRADGLAFHAGRLVSYAGAGAIAAAGMAALGAWAQASPLLRPLWTLVQLAFLGLGLWWLAAGRMPHRLVRGGAVPVRIVPRRRRVLRSALGGLAWVGWPCGALQGALLLAALADGAAGGATVMAAFALASSPGLFAAPVLWTWLRRIGGPAGASRLGYRCAGAALAASSAFALAATLRERIAALCAP